ncbi:hypothetical protein ACWGET_25795 [Streptomyces zaomyceticus]
MAIVGMGMSAQALRYSADSMETFRKDVQGLIDQLSGSEASADKIKTETVTRDKFGGGGAAWAEAQGVYAAYDAVLGRLVDLSVLLSDCLEGLGIAIVASKNGIEEMDDDVKRRMIEIHQRTKDAKRQAEIEAGKGAPASEGSEGTEGDGSFK